MQSWGGPIFGFQLPHPGVVPLVHDAHDCYLPTASAFIDPSFGGFKRLCCWFSQTSHLQTYEVWVNFITQFLKGHLFQEIWSTINLLQEYVQYFVQKWLSSKKNHDKQRGFFRSPRVPYGALDNTNISSVSRSSRGLSAVYFTRPPSTRPHRKGVCLLEIGKPTMCWLVVLTILKNMKVKGYPIYYGIFTDFHLACLGSTLLLCSNCVTT